MTRVDFYHLQQKNLEEVLPKLLQKAYSLNKRIKVKVGAEDKVEYLNALLWAFNDESFLPHGSKKDGFAEQQPIWLSSDSDNPNKAVFLFLVNGAEEDVSSLNNFERVFNIFDGKSNEALLQARRLWKEYKNAGLDVFYWQQDERGAWVQKA